MDISYIKTAWSRQVILQLAMITLVACGGPVVDDQQLVQTAREYLDNQKPLEAAIELRSALQENPKNAEARYLLGMISLDVGDLEAAEKEFRRARKVGWNEEEAQIGLARTLIASNEFKRVSDKIQIKEAYPPAARANLYGLQAIAQLGLEEVEKARETVATAAAIDANAYQVFNATIQLQIVSHELEGAAKTLEQAFTIYPDNTELFLLSAYTAEQKNDNMAARDAYQNIIDHDPAGIITFNGRKARLGLVRLEIEDKNLDQAQTILVSLLNKSGNDPESIYLNAMLAFEQGDLDIAEQRLLKVLKLAPDHIETQLLFGAVSYAQQDYEQAAYYISTYISAVPEDVDARKLLGRTYMMLEQYDVAYTALKPALKNNTEDADLLVLIGLSQFHAGDTISGIEGLETAYHVNPDNPVVLDAYGWVLVQQGEVANGRRLLNQALALQPDDAEIIYHYAVALMRSGEQSEGRRRLTSLLKGAQPFEGRDDAKAFLGE